MALTRRAPKHSARVNMEGFSFHVERRTGTSLDKAKRIWLALGVALVPKQNGAAAKTLGLAMLHANGKERERINVKWDVDMAGLRLPTSAFVYETSRDSVKSAHFTLTKTSLGQPFSFLFDSFHHSICQFRQSPPKSPRHQTVETFPDIAGSRFSFQLSSSSPTVQRDGSWRRSRPRSRRQIQQSQTWWYMALISNWN